MSFHLKELVGAGLVSARQEKQFYLLCRGFRAHGGAHDVRHPELLPGYAAEMPWHRGHGAATLLRNDSIETQTQKEPMKRFHVHVSVGDLHANVRFYSAMFGTPHPLWICNLRSRGPAAPKGGLPWINHRSTCCSCVPAIRRAASWQR